MKPPDSIDATIATARSQDIDVRVNGSWLGKFAALSLDSGKIQKCLDFYDSHRDIWQLAVFSGLLYFERHIEFLSPAVPIRAIGLKPPDRAPFDLRPLARIQSGLQGLWIDQQATGVDLGRFHDLRNLSVDWDKDLNLTRNQSLEALFLSGYRSPSGDLSDIAQLGRLTHLALFRGALTSTRGLSRFQSVVELRLDLLPKLTSLVELGDLPALTRLQLTGCKKFDTDQLRHARGLTSLTLDHCGEIPSLRFLDSLPNLRHLWMVETKVLDGDMSPLERLDSVYFTNRRHYSHTLDQVHAKIARRSNRDDQPAGARDEAQARKL